MPPLTETNYMSRRLKLQANIAAAKRAYEDAAFRQELGEIDVDAVKAARDAVTALEERVIGLDAAWKRTKEQIEAEHATASAKQRASVVAAVDNHLKVRGQAARRMAKLATELGEAWKQFEAANVGISEATLPCRGDLGGEGIKNLRHLLEGEFNSVKPSLGGELADAGLTLTSNDFTAASFRGLGREDGLVAFADKRNSMIREAIGTLVEDDA